MIRSSSALLFLLLVSPAGAAFEPGSSQSKRPANGAAAEAEKSSPADAYQKLLDEYEKVGGAKQFAARFLEFARRHPDDPAAVRALAWILKKRRSHPEATAAIGELHKNHLKSRALGAACASVAAIPSTASERLLRAALKNSPHADVRALACYHLTKSIELKIRIVDELKQQPELSARILQYYGKQHAEHLASLQKQTLEKKLEKVYERMAKSFPDVEVDGQKLGTIAERSLFRLRHLTVGRKAPDIEGEDIEGRKFKLSDYRGKVVVLSFWAHW